MSPNTVILPVVDSDLDKRIIRASRRILRPLVRILLRNGITAQAFQELARKEFVDVAHEEFGLVGRAQTISRVSVLTGLNRKEVARLLALPPLDESDQVWRNRAAAVLSAWVVDETFQDAKGDPLDLPFEGEGPDFTGLVRKHSGDMQPRAIADELERNGAIERVDGKLRMRRRGYVPLDDPSAMVDMLGTDTAELIETIDYNLRHTDSLLQGKVLAENLPAEHLDEFVRYSKRLARTLLEELTHWLRERDLDDDFSGTDRRYAVGLGLYNIVRTVRDGDDDGGEAADEGNGQ